MGCGPSRSFSGEKRFRRAIKLYEVSEVAELTSILNRNKCFESGESPLTLAAKEGHEAVVEVLLRGGANVNKVDRHGRAPLHIAVQLNDDETVDVLLDNKANVNKYDISGVTPLHIACEKGYKELVQKLLHAGAAMNVNDRCDPPIIIALRHGHSDCAIELLKHSADPNVRDFRGTSALQIAVANNDVMAVRCLLKNGAHTRRTRADDACLLSLAVLNESTEMVQELIQAGCSVDDYGSDEVPPIIAAVAVGSADCLDLIISANADVDTLDKRGQTGLQIAVLAVADVEKRTYYARYFSNVYRLYSKYDPNEINFEKYTKCAILLIECGADLSRPWQRFSQVFPSPKGLSYEELTLCEFLVQAYGFRDLGLQKMRSFIRGLLSLEEYGLIRLLCSVGVVPDKQDIYASNVAMANSSMEMIRWIQCFKKQPSKLNDICRLKIRKLMSRNIVHSLENMDIPVDLKQYICVLYPEHYSKVAGLDT